MVNGSTTKLIGAVLGGCEGLVELRFRDQRTGAWSSSFEDIGVEGWEERLEATTASLADWADVYIGLAPRTRKEGTVEATGRGHVVGFDLDDPGAVEALDDFPLAPDIVIETGSVTNGAPHLWVGWILDDDQAPRIIGSISARLCDLLGGDRGYPASAASIIRVPGTWNHKHPEPHPVKLAYLAVSPYSVEELEAELPAPRAGRASRPRPLQGDREEIVKRMLAEVEAEIIATENRNESIFRVGTAILWEAGWSKDEALLYVPEIVELANRVAPKIDDRYSKAECEASIKSRWKRGVVKPAPVEIAEIEAIAAEAHPLSVSATKARVALWSEARRQGVVNPEISERLWAEIAGIARRTLEKVIDGELNGSWCKRTRKGTKGKGSLWKLISPPLTSTYAFSYVPIGLLLTGTETRLQSQMPDAFSVGCLPLRSLAAVLSSKGPISSSELADIGGISDRTARRHLRRCDEFDLVEEVEQNRYRGDESNLTRKLLAAAQKLGTAERAEKRSERHSRERAVFEERHELFVERERQRREGRARGRMRRRSGPRRAPPLLAMAA